MTAKILDGKALAQTIREEVAEEVKKIQEQSDLTPGLAAILVGDNPASKIYVNWKAKDCKQVGIYSETITLPAETTTNELLSHIDRLNKEPKIHGILVQLPLPDHIPEDKIIRSISEEKDVDGFHPASVGKMVIGKQDTFFPCTPFGIQTLLLRNDVETEGRHLVVVGRSNIVGKPTAIMMMQKTSGANATVTVCHSRTRDLPGIIRQGDIVVAAIGRKEFVTAEMVKPGAVVIDVGINRIPDESKKSGYRLVGDVDYEGVKEVAGAITPVPGGVGPMTRAMLLVNTLKAAKKSLAT